MSTNRITQSDLQDLVTRINIITNSPATYSDKNAEGFKANVGHYFLDYAYGGVNLAQVVSDGGGITKPIGGGYHTKRELYTRLQSFIAGLSH